MKFLKSIFKTKKTKNISEKEDLIKFLAKVPLFDNLSKNERRNLSNFIHIRKYQNGETVFKKDYPNIVMYVVKEGELTAYIDNSEGENVKNIKSTEYFGEVGIFVDKARTATIVAVKNSILLAISKRDMRAFLGEFPKAASKILYKLGQILSNHLVNSNKAILKKNEQIAKIEKELLSKSE